MQTGFELIDENNDSITEPIDFILEDSEGVKQEYQSIFGYLILDVFENKVYTIKIAVHLQEVYLQEVHFQEVHLQVADLPKP